MPMLLIQGSFRIVGSRPDGSTVRFYPDGGLAHWDLLPGPHRVEIRGPGGGNLRLEGIDSLETHFPPPYGTHGPVTHQPRQFADAAAAELLSWLGFESVQRRADGTVLSPTNPQQVPGYVLTRRADRYGRCVALVGRGDGPQADSKQVYVTVEMLRETVNHHLLSTGLVYPTYYRSLFPDLRDELTSACDLARRQGLGLWPQDMTAYGTEVTGPPTISEDVIWPKLYRRLSEYVLNNDGEPDLGGFPDFLARQADRFYILSTGHFSTGLDLTVAVEGRKVKVTQPIEDLVFDE